MVFGVTAGLLSALIYTIVPYTVFFDRMALVDSMLAAFTIWSLFFAIWLVKSQRLDLAMILGYLLGGGLMVKTPAILNFVSLPFTVLIFKRVNKFSLLKLLVLWLIAVFIALAIYNILRLGPDFAKLQSRNGDYVFAPNELIGRPLDPFIPHFNDISDWFPKLLTMPIVFLLLYGSFSIFIKRHDQGLVILLWVLLPMVIQMAFLKTFTARYILFSIPPLLVISGYAAHHLLNWIKGSTRLKYFLFIILLLPLPLYFNYLLITKPEDAPLPRGERRGYFEEWTAGYGFKEIASFLAEEKKKGSVVVGTEGYFGTLPDGLMIYLDKAGIPVIGDQATISAKLRDAAKENKTFFIANKSRFEKAPRGIMLIKTYPKAKPIDNYPQDAIVVYRVYPK